MGKINEITVVGCGAMGSRLIRAIMNGGNRVVIVELNQDVTLPSASVCD